jgi:beta-N-acetylhexosaminidase
MNEADLGRVGLHFLLGLQPAPSLTDHDKRILSVLRPAGVVLFKKNFSQEEPYDRWLALHAKQIEDIRACVGRDDFLVCIDHEGGRIMRLPPPITRFAPPLHWGAKVGAVAGAMARELASLAVNVTFSPSLDINSNPLNPVIGDRAFGSTLEVVREAGAAFIRNTETAGLIACPKHFPGHGDTTVDSHRALPSIDLSLPELRAREVVPFQDAVRAGVRMIMTAHVMFPALDPQCPATLSEKILTGLLRRDLGYQGVIVTDDLGMQAVSSCIGDPEGPIRMVKAGCDLLMVCAHWTDTRAVLGMAQSLLEAATRGQLSLDRSSERIERLLRSAGRFPVRALTSEELDRHAGLGPLFGGETVEVI